MERLIRLHGFDPFDPDAERETDGLVGTIGRNSACSRKSRGLITVPSLTSDAP